MEGNGKTKHRVAAHRANVPSPSLPIAVPAAQVTRPGCPTRLGTCPGCPSRAGDMWNRSCCLPQHWCQWNIPLLWDKENQTGLSLPPNPICPPIHRILLTSFNGPRVYPGCSQDLCLDYSAGGSKYLYARLGEGDRKPKVTLQTCPLVLAAH